MTNEYALTRPLSDTYLNMVLYRKHVCGFGGYLEVRRLMHQSVRRSSTDTVLMTKPIFTEPSGQCAGSWLVRRIEWRALDGT